MRALIHRRSIVGTAAAFAAGLWLPARAGNNGGGSGGGSGGGGAIRTPNGPTLYTTTTAPDKLTARILGRSLNGIDQGSSSPEDLARAINRNFAQLIEQSYAQMSPARLTWVMERMQDRELADLAALYTNAIVQFGNPALALDVCALRLDPKALARVALHFGSEPVYAAIVRSAPAKTNAFLSECGGRWWPSPLLVSTGATSAGGPNVDMTPRQIYQAFRSGTFGSLSISGALHESISYMGPRFALYASSGFAFGTYVVAPLIQTYAPTLWQVIGSTISSIIQPIIDAITPTEKGAAQRDLSTDMNLGPIASSIGASGGDYGCCSYWRDYAGGSGGCAIVIGGDPWALTTDQSTWDGPPINCY